MESLRAGLAALGPIEAFEGDHCQLLVAPLDHVDPPKDIGKLESSPKPQPRSRHALGFTVRACRTSMTCGRS